MQIKIITIHNIYNFGSVFQAMALNTFLRGLGYDSQIIDYCPPYFKYRSIRSEIGKLLFLKSFLVQKRKYNSFFKNYMNLTSESFSTVKELSSIKDSADLFISGGDQLWNDFYPCGRDDAYKLSFTEKPKIAFGTSLGRKRFTRESLQSLAEKIRNFSSLGIRESSGARLLAECGLLNVEHVCDPVFLMTKSFYQNLLPAVDIKEKYMFVYLVDSSPLLSNAIHIISTSLGLKVVQCVGFRSRCKSDVKLTDVGPEETLSYIVNADFVISASFHATAFATLFHKPFITLLPGENTNARIEDFLGFVSLSERLCRNEDDVLNSLRSKIDWTISDKLLEHHISKSKDFLVSAIQNIK